MILNSQMTKFVEERCVDEGTEHIELMTRAGAAVAKFAVENYDAARKSVAVLCGRGNNGGDGFAVAALLAKNGAKVRMLLTHGYPTTPDAIDLFGRAERAKIKCLLYNVQEDREDFFRTLQVADIIIDAVCGTGFNGTLDENLSEIFEHVNISKAKVIAVDVPSGVHADTGCAEKSAVKADATITFTTKKPCHIIYPGAQNCGKVHVADIGIDISCVSNKDCCIEVFDFQNARLCFPPRKNNTHKGDYGKLLVICGSESMPGAAVFAIRAAVRSGVGLVKTVIPEKCVPVVASHVPDTTFLALQSDIQELNETDKTNILNELKTSTACLIGCGIGVSERAKQIVELVAENAEIPLIIDADAINCIAQNPDILTKAKAEIIITPHPGEMGRLTGKKAEEVQMNRLETAIDFSKHKNIIVVLKGANTIIAYPDGKVFVNTTGNPGMAKGGSGDVLAGLISSLRAQGKNASDAASCGVFIHGECGDRAAEKYSVSSMTPCDMIEMLPSVFSDLER